MMISTFFVGLMAIAFFRLFRKFKFQKNNNDTNSSVMSLPSPPTSLARNFNHHVFPSFHGADVRENILSHMLASFKSKGINPFIDEDIERGKSIGPELIKAIRGSRIAIVLLSKNYASSSWCLDELAEIIKCREVLGQIVMPIFYKVDPTDVKKQTGDFGTAFRKTCKSKTKEHIERWRRALVVVATIVGEHFRNWINDAAMIEKIATDVSNMLNISMPSRDFDDYVGMKTHMERMECMLCLEDLDDVKMIGIWGPPGIGKTTIARVVFNQFSRRFPLGTIMVNIKGCYPRPCLDEYNVQLQLQNQMLSQLINQKDIMVSHLGVAQEWLKDKKVLLVLDEVDRLGQLHALAKEVQWFGQGSRIIITTEDRSLLKAHRINHIYKVNFPSSDEAFQIFCIHAFGQKHPNDGFYRLARQVSYLAGELPLGLKILGSALRGKSKEEWEMIIPRLKTSLDGEIESIIKFSYNALCDEDKYLFLYIACFFNHHITRKVEDILANKILNVRQGLHILVEKSLISINEFGRIEMHTLLEQLGRETSREQFVHNGFEKRHLLVNERDISEVLTNDTIDCIPFIAINVELSKWAEEEWTEEELNISDKTLKRMSDLQFVRVHSYLLPPWEIAKWQLVLESLIFYSPKIRSLVWESFGNICLPSTFNPKFLVELVLPHNRLQKLWEDNKLLPNLKWMDLSFSPYLKELPDLSTATKFEELVLRGCKNLEELPNLSAVTKLVKLNLEDCSSLVKLPSSIGDLTKIAEFDLSNCSSLVELPSSIGTAINLQKLDLRGCSSLVKLPLSIVDLINLIELDLSNCSNLVELPSSIGNLQKLRKLTMCGWSKLEALPTNINLESLAILDLTSCSHLKRFPEISTNIRDLNLSGTSINEIPLTIMAWPHLCKLKLKDCNNLVSLPQFSDSLSYLVASNCNSLERLDCSFDNPEFHLIFSNCFKLNQEARDLIMHTSTRKYAILPGAEVPACFNLRATDGGLLTIKFNESPLPTYFRFKACITLVKGDSEEETSDYETLKLLQIDMMNKQNDHMISCGSSIHLISECLTDHIYIFEVSFKFGEEVGTSTELVVNFTINSRKWTIGEWGLMKIEAVPSCYEHEERASER